MADALAPRGPDGTGVLAYDHIGLGQRRLKIFDLSDRARQPMSDNQLGLTLVHNGAVYNYRELRRELEGEGYRFFSDGDTEVVLKAYHAWGDRCFERFNGMFAVAIAERESGRLILARDRLGIKPLYYASVNGGVRFASTVPALLAGGGIGSEIDSVALHHYLSFHAVVPAPRTILAGIGKVPPATIATIAPDGRWQTRSYWTLRFETPANDRTEVQWAANVCDQLSDAVRRRTIADVEVGVLLSGGLDSSLLVALLAQTPARRLKTFSVGFESVAGETGDEFRYSDVVAERFDTDHTRIRVSSDRLVAALPDCIHAMAEPMVSHDVVGFYLLSQEVARHVKVVQSGQGADEVFAGYHWYPPMAESTSPVDTYRQVFFDRDHAEYRQVVHPRLASEDFSREFVSEQFAQPGAGSGLEKALRLDTTVMLVEDPVKRVDNMTMAWGLEARVPFLDHEVVELAARVPTDLKVSDGGKGILKRIARTLLPAELIDRPKGYFPVPALRYFRGPYLELVRAALTGTRARQRALFNQDYVEHLLADPDAHQTPLRGSKLWQLGLLELWLESHGL